MQAEKHPLISDARQLGQRDGCSRVIVIFQLRNGRAGYASWGATRGLCESTRRIADQLLDQFDPHE